MPLEMRYMNVRVAQKINGMLSVLGLERSIWESFIPSMVGRATDRTIMPGISERALFKATAPSSDMTAS